MQEPELRNTLADIFARLSAQYSAIGQLGNQTQENAARVNKVAVLVDQIGGQVSQVAGSLNQ